MEHVIVTGTGRCGTGYVAAILKECGVPTGHEQVYNDGTADGARPICWTHYPLIECSWLASQRLPVVGPHVVQLVRDPLAVTKSLVDLAFFEADTHYTRAVYALSPEVEREQTPWDRALSFWIRWNVRTSLYAERVLRVETLTEKDIYGLVGMTGWREPVDATAALNVVRRDTNAKTPDKLCDWAATWDAFRPALARTGRMLAGAYGYPTPG